MTPMMVDFKDPWTTSFVISVRSADPFFGLGPIPSAGLNFLGPRPVSFFETMWTVIRLKVDWSRWSVRESLVDWPILNMGDKTLQVQK